MQRIKPKDNWITRSKIEIEHEEEFLLCRRIALKFVQYMREHNMLAEDLAKKLGVSTQYVNKLIHGQCLDFKVASIIKYSKILGIEVIKISE